MRKNVVKKEGYLYLLELTSINKSDNECFYKIGICNKGVIYRYRYSLDLKYEVRVLMEIAMPYVDARELEKVIKVKYTPYLYQPKYPFAGSVTECFSILPTISLNNDHHIYKYTLHNNIVDNIELGLHIGKDNIKQDDIDFSRIKIFKVENIPNRYNKVWSKSILGYSSFQKNKELLPIFGNLIYNIAKNKRDINGNKFGVYMPQNLLNLFYTQESIKGKLKGITKYINPTDLKYWADNVFVCESFVTPNIEKDEGRTNFTIQRLHKVLSYTKYMDGHNINLYFINVGICQALNRELNLEILSVDWNSFIKHKRGKDE